MIEVRRAADRFHTQFDWLDSWHSFAFGPHYNEKHVQFGPLRVLNDDTVAPGAGFGIHRHSEMEIVSIVLAGALAHRDSTGTEQVLRAGEVQRMTAGTGVAHSEYNASDDEPVRFLQVWVLPGEPKLNPEYEQRDFSQVDRRNRLVAVVSGRRAPGALSIRQDAEFLLGSIDRGERVERPLAASRRAYLFMIEGGARVEGEELSRRDGAKVEGVARLSVEALEPSELLLIDLP